MAVRYRPAARKALKTMPRADADALMRKLDAYAKTGAGDVKKLQGADMYRLRHRDWRAIFAIEGGVLVVRIAHRREVYR